MRGTVIKEHVADPSSAPNGGTRFEGRWTKSGGVTTGLGLILSERDLLNSMDRELRMGAVECKQEEGSVNSTA